MKLHWMIFTVWLIAGCAQPGQNAPDSDTDTLSKHISGGICGPSTNIDADDKRIYLTDESNYTFDSRLDIQRVDVAANADIHFDWQDVTSDMYGHPLPSSEIDMLQVILFELSRDELAQKMNEDTLSQPDIPANGVVQTSASQTDAFYLNLQFGGVPIGEEKLLSYVNPDAYDTEVYTHAAILTTGTTMGKGARLIKLFRPVEGETNTTVRFTDDDTRTTYSADIYGVTPVRLPEGRTDITVNWMEHLTENGLGHPFYATRITAAEIIHFNDLAPPDLEARFLDLERLADVRFRIDIDAGAEVRLDTLIDNNGTPFSGIDNQGTWILALFCGACANPAPWFLTVLRPCALPQ